MGLKLPEEDSKQLINDPVYRVTTEELNPIEEELQSGKLKTRQLKMHILYNI